MQSRMIMEEHWSSEHTEVTLRFWRHVDRAPVLELTRMRGSKQRTKTVRFQHSDIPYVKLAVSHTLDSWPTSRVSERVRETGRVTSVYGNLVFGWIPYGGRYNRCNGLMIRQIGWSSQAIVVEQGDAAEFVAWFVGVLDRAWSLGG